MMITYQELANTVNNAESYAFALRVAQDQLQAATNAFKSAPSLAYRLIADKERKEASTILDTLKLYYYELVPHSPDYTWALDTAQPMVTVPETPTHAQLQAGVEVEVLLEDTSISLTFEELRRIYSAMLSAR